jgi:protease-4
MDSSMIADRRRLRRKLGFWRVVAILLVVALGLAAYGNFGGATGPAGSRMWRI